MNKIILLSLSLMSLTSFAQTEQKAMFESKAYDNWYIGVNGGVATKTTHSKWIKNVNANVGARVGRWFTPAFGLALESNAYLGDKPMPHTGTIVKYLNTDIAATINLFNWWFGYQGQPRTFEVIAVPAVGMGHFFTNKESISHGLNDFTGKLALDFAVNVDKKKSLQFYLEPALLYSIYGNATGSNEFGLNVNRSHFQLNAGVIYKFKNSNGSHNFKYAKPTVITDQAEINRLNSRIEELMAENEQLKNRPAPSIVPAVREVKVTEIIDVVAFKQGSSFVEPLQYPTIDKVAQYMKANTDVKIHITGYASTEGSAERNQKLSEARAEAVKHALITKYGIESRRLTISGEGATEGQSDTLAHNRVAVFSIAE